MALKIIRIALISLALGLLLLAVRTYVIWQAPRPTHGAVQLLPGTARASAEVGSISLSPAGRWLAFTELTAEPTGAKDLRPRDMYSVASVDLESGEATSHSDSSKCAWNEYLYETIGWEGAASWQGEALLLRDCDGRGRYLAMRGGHQQLEVVERSRELLTCSDCAVASSAMHAIDWPQHLTSNYSYTADGTAVYYQIDGVRMADAAQSGRKVVSPFAKKYLGMTTQFAQLRVSPDGHYLAYCVFYSLYVPVIPGSGWVHYLYLKDLRSGREARIAARFSLSNLVWSRDSRRLFFAGVDLPNWGHEGPLARGIYVVDARDVFGVD